MSKKLLSMLLVLSMVFTLLPISAMAEEAHTTIDTNGEIIAFAPLIEIEKSATTGTSTGDLELPEFLTATVRTAVIAGEESVQDSASQDTVTDDSAIAITGSAIKATGVSPMVAIEEYNLWVGVTRVSSANASDVLGDGTVSYEAYTKTLTLNNASINKASIDTRNSYMDQICILNYDELILNLVGENNITGVSSGTSNYGIKSSKLTIQGEGSLSVTSNANRVDSSAILTTNELTINGGTLNVIGYKCGIYDFGSKTTINGGTVTAQGGQYGLYSSSSIIINGGTVTALGGQYGLYASYKITVNGGTVMAQGTQYGSYSYIMTINDGTITAKSDGKSMSKAPNLSGYPNVQIIASSTDIEGGDASVISTTALADNIISYKYLKFIPVIIAPYAPTIGTATAGDGQATISFTPPTFNGGAEITNYTVTSSPGDITVTGASSPITVTGLTNGTAYTFTVTATNSVGTSAASASSNSVTATPSYVPDALTGNVTISGTLKYGQTLTAAYEQGNNTGTLSYQWKRGGADGANIGANSYTYTIEETDINQTLTCVVTSDEQTGFVSNSTSATIDKADGSAVTGVSVVGCTTADNNDGKLIGVTTAMEYKKFGDTYYTAVTGSAITVTGGTITELTSGKYLVRIAETDTHIVGPDTTFTVAAFIPVPIYTISGTITGSDTNSGIAGAVVQLKSGGSNIGSSVFTDSRGAYTISDVPAGTYTIEVNANSYDSGTVSSFGVSEANISGKDLTLTKTVIFIPVTDITMTNGASVQAGTNLTLTGTMTPGDATNRTITWSVENANGTGAIIIGNTFRATLAGTATVKATVVNGLSASSDYTKTFTITVIAVPTPTPSPTPTEKPEGKVEMAQQQNDGAPAANVNNSSDELKISVLSTEDQEMVARGENAKIILKVTDISALVIDEEKKLIQDKLAVEHGVSENVAADIPVLYVDLSIYKQVGSLEQTKVTETKGKISISLKVPKEFWNSDLTKSRAFYVIRIHDGVATRIEGSYDADKHLFTFETDRFSTYALTYQDTSLIKTYQDFYHLQLKAKAGKTSQTLSYKRIVNVDGYLIYGGKCGEEMAKLAELPANTTSYTVKNLKQGTYYKYQVKAYRIIDGEQVIIMTSKVIHSITESKTYANPTKVTSDIASVNLVTGETKTVTGQVVLPKGKKLKDHTVVIRYESTNKAVATVNSKGKITAKAKGICYVYAYAQNGVCKRIKVIVE